MISDKNYQHLKFQALNDFWGYSTFRNAQEGIIDAVVAGNDAVVLLPTGGGKSLCYQLPALILEGICIVVSPLLALMKDQVMQLRQRGIEADYISSEFDEDEMEIIYSRCKNGETKLLYVSPERIKNPQFLQHLEDIQISFVAVDEAHCISEWGQDFRPSYQNLKEIRTLFPHLPYLALTATATPKVLTEIIEKLGLKSPKVFKNSFKRENIRISVEETADKYTKIYQLIKFYNTSGIVYTSTRKDAELLTEYLQRNGLKNVDYFHAGLSSKERHFKQNRWINSSGNVLICTNAFGMGIDKDNVRFVIHFSPPPSVENYYQEIGRAGRDGKESYAHLLWNEQEIKNFDEILKSQIASKSEYQKIVGYLYSIFQVADLDSSEEVFQLELQRIKTFTSYSYSKIKGVLSFLHNQEVIYYNANPALSSLELKVDSAYLEELPAKYSYFIELLQRHLPGLLSHKVWFSIPSLCKKLEVEPHNLKERLKDFEKHDYIKFIDGNAASVKFLKPRNDRALNGFYWNLFYQIQKNKIQKWEEMKFYLQNGSYCKMSMILTYFGEKTKSNCGKCSVCLRKKGSSGNQLNDKILSALAVNPAELDEITLRIGHHQKEKVLEHLILLLDAGKIKMLNFKTYSLV